MSDTPLKDMADAYLAWAKKREERYEKQLTGLTEYQLGPDKYTLLELCPVCEDDGTECVWCEDSEAPGYVEHQCESA